MCARQPLPLSAPSGICHWWPPRAAQVQSPRCYTVTDVSLRLVEVSALVQIALPCMTEECLFVSCLVQQVPALPYFSNHLNYCSHYAHHEWVVLRRQLGERDRYLDGVAKMHEVQGAIISLRGKIEVMQPRLDASTRDAERLAAHILAQEQARGQKAF